MQEQHKAQQKMLLDLIKQELVAHKQDVTVSKDRKKKETEDSCKIKLSKLTLQKLMQTDNVEHFLVTFKRITALHK